MSSELGCQHTVKSGQNQQYVAILTDFRRFAKAVVERIQFDFKTWLCTIIMALDLDVSDHETAAPDSEDEAELSKVEITSIGRVDEIEEESFD